MLKEKEKTYIEEYYNWSLDNPNKVPKKVKILLKKLVKDIKEPQIIEEINELTNEKEKVVYVFDKKLATKPILFIETFCMHSKGKHRGKPFKLELWQKAVIESIYGFVNEKTRLRKYTKAVIFIGRKNGKSTLASALALYHLMGDNEGGAEVYSVAVKRDQAKIVWDEAKNMIKFSPALRSRTKTTISEIRYDAENGKFKALASDSNSLDGLNAYFVSADEIHAWKDPNLLNVMYDSMGSRDEPLLLMTTTMGFVRENVFDNEYAFISKVITGYLDKNKGAVQENLIAWVYELDDVTDIEDKEKWYKANPRFRGYKIF